ncbi:hypothetical protein [Burkholderia stabilis]|uniref:hypothetical protein n=1 Tax=Burkholderia stabilis TaxID=95485 RepID=UPI001F4BA9B7|nr:hypothetical protein [Burkholderia stabilis]
MRRSIVDVCQTFPGDARNDSRPRPEHDAPVPLAEHSALADPSTACTVRSIGVDAGGTSFALVGEGRDCFGSTVYSFIEEIYVF